MAQYPFAPEHKWGFVFSREGRRLVLWVEDGAVEPDLETPATEEDLSRFRELLADSPRPVVREADGRLGSALEEQGFLLVGDRQYRFMSGILLQRADLLAEVAADFNLRRDQKLNDSGGLEPSGFAEWLDWYRVTHTASSAATAADVMAAAAIEAFINEVLANSYPELYETLEKKRRAAPRVKLQRLMEELSIPQDASWMDALNVGLDRRRELSHFRPGYVDDESLVAGGLESSAQPLDARAFVDAVFDAVEEILAAMESSVPPTHVRWREAAVASARFVGPS
jgi:hypothetical protein